MSSATRRQKRKAEREAAQAARATTSTATGFKAMLERLTAQSATRGTNRSTVRASANPTV